MNRTQRAIKRACHRALDQAKHKKRVAVRERDEASYDSFDKRAAELRSAVREEKSIKAWHRKIIMGNAVNDTSKEEQTA